METWWCSMLTAASSLTDLRRSGNVYEPNIVNWFMICAQHPKLIKFKAREREREEAAARSWARWANHVRGGTTRKFSISCCALSANDFHVGLTTHQAHRYAKVSSLKTPKLPPKCRNVICCLWWWLRCAHLQCTSCGASLFHVQAMRSTWKLIEFYDSVFMAIRAEKKTSTTELRTWRRNALPCPS